MLAYVTLCYNSLLMTHDSLNSESRPNFSTCGLGTVNGASGLKLSAHVQCRLLGTILLLLDSKIELSTGGKYQKIK